MFMKAFISLASMALIFSTIGCAHQGDADPSALKGEAIIATIAADPDYDLYQKQGLLNAGYISQSYYDLDGIHNYIRDHIEEHPANAGFCSIPVEEISKFRGGREYIEINCAMEAALLRLAEKYPQFSTLGQEGLARISKKYQDTHPEYHGQLEENMYSAFSKIKSHED